MFSKFRALFPTIIFLLVSVLLSMVILNYFQVDMNDNTGFKVLNRALSVEGMKNKKEGLCPGRRQQGMGNMNLIEGNETQGEEEGEGEGEEEDVADPDAFVSNLMN